MKRSHALIAVFFASFFVVGLPYWDIPYSQASLPSDIWNAGLLVVGVLAGAVRIMSNAGFGRTTLVLGSSVPAAVMARVIVEVAGDSSRHNLWPIEIVFSAAPGFLAAATGALLGGLLAHRMRA